MNRQQFKLASHEFRELNFRARTNSANHICNARNCACRDSWQERHTGWQWRIAQQFGEGMATRLLRMFVNMKAPDKSVMSWKTQVGIGFIKDKNNRRRALRDVLARIDARFPHVKKESNPATSASSLPASRSNTSGAAEVSDLLEVCSISGDAS